MGAVAVQVGRPTPKWVKPPYNPITQQPTSVTDTSTWGSFDEALAVASAQGWDGIGFVLTRLDDVVGVDLTTAGIRRQATSPLGCRHHRASSVLCGGVSVGRWRTNFSQGTLPSGLRRQGNIELYDQGRYLTVTGQHLVGTPTTIESRQDALNALHTEISGQRLVPAPERTEAAPRRLRDTTVLPTRSKGQESPKVRAAVGRRYDRLSLGQRGRRRDL